MRRFSVTTVLNKNSKLSWKVLFIYSLFSVFITLLTVIKDPQFIEHRKNIAGKILIVEQRIVKMLKYRKQVTKVLPHPYRLVYDIPERLVTVRIL